MDEREFEKIAKEMVVGYVNRILNKDKPNGEKKLIRPENVFVVWKCKILGNNKCMAAIKNDGRYYEVTYNGNSKEFYFDSYVKEANAAADYSAREGQTAVNLVKKLESQQEPDFMTAEN